MLLVCALTGWGGAGSYSPDGQIIATANDYGNGWVYDAPTGELLSSRNLHANRIWTLAFSPNPDMTGHRRVFATGSYDKTAKLWTAAYQPPWENAPETGSSATDVWCTQVFGSTDSRVLSAHGTRVGDALHLSLSNRKVLEQHGADIVVRGREAATATATGAGVAGGAGAGAGAATVTDIPADNANARLLAEMIRQQEGHLEALRKQLAECMRAVAP